jgi:membrane protease YdiL (CAAX protease family)
VNELMTSLSPDDVTIPAFLAGLCVMVLFIAGLTVDCIILSGLKKHREAWADKCAHLRKRPWIWTDAVHLLLVLGTVFAAMVLAAQIMEQCGIILSVHTERLLLLGETLLMQGVAITTVEYLRRRHRQSPAACFASAPLSWKSDIKQGLVFYLAVIPPVVLSAFLAKVVLQYFDLPIESQGILVGFADPTAPFWFRGGLVGLAIILAPLVEEIAFRGIALPLVAKHASPATAVIVVSILFALVHAHLPAMVPLFVVAVGFALAYIHSGSILVPITMHAIFNSVNLLVFYLSYDMTQL